MQLIKKQNFFAAMLLLLFFVTSGFAVESVNCVNDFNSEDNVNRCKFYRIWTTVGGRLFVVKPGDVISSANAIPGAKFFVTAPDVDIQDSVALLTKPEAEKIQNMMPVTADSLGLFNFTLYSKYELTNFRLGTAENESEDPLISLIYNFYVPQLKYFVEGKEVTDKSKLAYQVGDTMKVDVEAIIPMGPKTGKLDSTLKRTFYISDFGDSKNIEYYSLAGENLRQSNGNVMINVDGGKCSFYVVATKAITDGSSFTLNAFDDGKDKNGNPQFILTEKFPGDFEFTNPGMPTLNGAAIYDTDGDGIGDSIATWFGGNIDSMTVKDFYYSWPKDGDFSHYDGEVSQKGPLFGLPDVKVDLQKDSATGSIKAYVCTSVGNRCDTLKTDIKDSIGAAIQNATLIKGDGAKDTLVIRFNKEMDTHWTSGNGFKLNGVTIDVEAFAKKGNEWAFVVDTGIVAVGDLIKIETTCKSGCPDGILTAADGIPTNKNNQEVVVKNSGRLYVDSDKNGFYDCNGDGRMDSASVGFEMPITQSDLKKMDFTFYWLNSKGEVIALTPTADELTLSEDGTVVGFKPDPEKYDIKNMLTAIDKSYSKDGEAYGYVKVTNRVTVDGKEVLEDVECEMNDFMPPVISKTFLQPESFQKMEPDKFKVTFSEAIDYKNVDFTDDCLEFFVDGKWVSYNLGSAKWDDDGKSVTFLLEAGEDLSSRMNPADSVRFGNFTNGIVDKKGNLVSDLTPPVMVQGDPRVIMKTTSFADLNKAEELSGKVKPFTIDHVKSTDEAYDKSSLGVLMDVGFSTIMTEDSSGFMVPKMEDIGLSWELFVYTNVGTYVGSASGNIPCDDPFFDGNCLENPDKLYVRWNMRADNGRRVGVGVYLVKFKIKVFGAKEDFKIERIFRWGISAKKR